MTEAVDVPEGLAAMPPGPALAAVLAGVDLARVANNELLPVLRAQSRQAAHEQARLLAVIAEVGRAKPTFDDREVARLPYPHQYCADEVRAALAWSRRAADRETDLAEHVVHGLPLVHAAFLAGEIDRPKVRVFSDHLAGLTPAQVHTICAAVVPVAGRLTPGQIAARLRRLILAVDPRHYERRYRKGLRDRTVIGYLADDGTATITTTGLTPAEAAAALERIDTLARAARNAGHPSTLDQIRVDILVGLLDGTLHHLDRDAMIAHLIAHRSPNDNPTLDTGPTADGNDKTETASGTADSRPADGAPEPGSRSDDRPAGDNSQHDTDTTTGTEPAAETATTPSPTPLDEAAHAPGQASDDGSLEDQRVGVEVRVEVSTLLGRDEHPGELAGWGPITAQHARDTVARQRRAEWRFAVTDDDGRLVFDGLTRRRPPDMDRAGPRGGVVELQIPATLLDHLADAGEPAGGTWTGVIADIARQYADRDSRDLDAHPTDRFPRADLRRHVQVRDRTCVGPGCRHRAQRCDQDHTITTTSEAPPSSPTSNRCADTTTPSSTRQAGSSSNPNQVCSSGPAHSAAPTASSPNPSSHPLPIPNPAPTTPGTTNPPRTTTGHSACAHPPHHHHHPSATRTNRHPSECATRRIVRQDRGLR